jgi:hypothetical protein
VSACSLRGLEIQLVENFSFETVALETKDNSITINCFFFPLSIAVWKKGPLLTSRLSAAVSRRNSWICFSFASISLKHNLNAIPIRWFYDLIPLLMSNENRILLFMGQEDMIN